MSNNIIDKIQLSGVTYDIGGGGGKAIEAGRGIAITTGETADTVSFNLPISAGTNPNSLIIGESTNISSANRSIATGYKTKAQQSNAFAQGYQTNAGQEQSHAEGYQTKAYGVNSHSEGKGTSAMTLGSHAEGLNTITSNSYEHTQGQYNVSNKANTTFGDSGNTLFSVGNGTANNARHNAFEIRQNGDIYITSGGTDIKLQDNLGGGGSSYTAGDGIDITNDVISVTGKVDTSAITTSVSSSSTDAQVPSAKAVNDKLGGLSLVKLTQAEYDSLSTYDSNTLYVIVN